MAFEKWLNENTTSLQGKTVAITGSTGGLMKNIVKVFASLCTNFIFLNRNEEKTKKQIDELTLLYPNIKIEFIACDLSNFENVKSATEKLKQKHIDILYLSAGVYNVKRYNTDLGYDNVFQTNFISHYYIAKELLTNLKAVNGKIVAVSSIAYNYSKIDTNDIDFSTTKKHSKVYGNSKRFLTYSLMELCKIENVDLSIVHPGVTLTEMTNHYPKAINWFVKIFIKLFLPNNEKASLSLIKGLFENTSYGKWIGPKIFNVWGKPKLNKLKSFNLNEVHKTYEIAENIYNKIKKED